MQGRTSLCDQKPEPRETKSAPETSPIIKTEAGRRLSEVYALSTIGTQQFLRTLLSRVFKKEMWD